MSQWCLPDDVRIRIPELRENASVLSDADIERYITIATQWVQMRLSVHYDLTLFATTQPIVVQQMTAVHTALILLSAISVSANGESIMKALRAEEKGYLRGITGSNLRYDDGSHIPSTATYEETVDIPSQVQEAWPDGNRPGFDIAPCTC